MYYICSLIRRKGLHYGSSVRKSFSPGNTVTNIGFPICSLLFFMRVVSVIYLVQYSILHPDPDLLHLDSEVLMNSDSHTGSGGGGGGGILPPGNLKKIKKK